MILGQQGRHGLYESTGPGAKERQRKRRLAYMERVANRYMLGSILGFSGVGIAQISRLVGESPLGWTILGVAGLSVAVSLGCLGAAWLLNRDVKRMGDDSCA